MLSKSNPSTDLFHWH